MSHAKPRVAVVVVILAVSVVVAVKMKKKVNNIHASTVAHIIFIFGFKCL